MKLHKFNSFLACLVLAGTVHAADQQWSNLGVTADWNTSDLNWDGPPQVAWVQDNHAIFGGTGETVAITEDGGIRASGLQRESGATYTLKHNATLVGPWTPVASPVPAANADQSGVPTDYDRFKVTLPIGTGNDFFRVEGVEN